MKRTIVAFVVFVMLLSISYVRLREKESTCAKPVKIEDISFIYFRTNEENTKAMLSFCLCDESEQYVTARIGRSDSGDISISLWQGDGVYQDVDQNTLMLVHKSPLPGLTQSIEKEGKEEKAMINGFTVEFELTSSSPENCITIGDKSISLKKRGIMHKAPGSPKFTTSWPVAF